MCEAYHHLHNGRVAKRDGEMQGGVPPGVGNVGAGIVAQQRHDAVKAAAQRHHVQRRATLEVERVDVAAHLDEGGDHLARARPVQRGAAELHVLK